MTLRITDRPSPNFDDRGGAPIDILLLHYTGMPTAEEALRRLTDPAAKVSAHYTVDEDGTVYSHVDETARAWHAGVSFWQGARDINARSIGIEIVNPGHEFGYRDFPAAQIDAVIALGQDIVRRHGIAAGRVLGHSDVAPARKQDPGERFPWARLAKAGLGLWPDPVGGWAPFRVDDPDRVAGLQRDLQQFGYELDVTGLYDGPLRIVVTAFQRHYQPGALTGLADGETAARLDRLLALTRQ